MENYGEKVAGFTDEKLHEYLVNRYKYIPEIVLAALAESQKRGRVFSEEEIAAIYADTKEELQKNISTEFNNVSATPVEEIPDQEYYSLQVIRVFSVLFSTFFGSILMAMNLSRTPGKKGMYEVLIFGLVYTIAIIIIANNIPKLNSIGIIFNLAGSFLIEYFFWNKYIGAKTDYRKRSFWVPLIVGLTISALMIFLIIASGQKLA
ncbi:hypothetical protein BH09BAC5_BH09BAC5_19660 [soil metagenome]